MDINTSLKMHVGISPPGWHVPLALTFLVRVLTYSTVTPPRVEVNFDNNYGRGAVKQFPVWAMKTSGLIFQLNYIPWIFENLRSPRVVSRTWNGLHPFTLGPRCLCVMGELLPACPTLLLLRREWEWTLTPLLLISSSCVGLDGKRNQWWHTFGRRIDLNLDKCCFIFVTQFTSYILVKYDEVSSAFEETRLLYSC